jgi:hypothetical protein
MPVYPFRILDKFDRVIAGQHSHCADDDSAREHAESSSLRLRALASKFGAMRSRCPAALVLRLGTTAWHFPSSPTEPLLLRESQHFGEPDVDTWRAALLMVKRYGDRAAFEVAMRANLALAEGDVDVAAAWRRILDALDRLQAKAPADGEKVH